jgi:hypothetical protein
MGRRAQEVSVPNSERSHYPRNILAERSLGGVAVDALCAGQELAESVGADGDGQGQANAAPNAVPAANPIPKAKGSFGADSKGFNLVEVGT